MKASAAVLLTCHNRKNTTLSTLELLEIASENVSNIEWDIYLVDDGSTDGTGVAVAQEFPKVKIIKGDGNLFWNRGMIMAWKAAIKSAEYDFYVWLNDDTQLLQDGLETLWTNSISKGHQAIISGVCISSTQRKEITYSGQNLASRQRLHPNPQPTPCDFFNGNLVWIPKYVYNKLGLLDDTFHHALGDFDYGLRAKKKGLKSFVATKITSICDRHNSLPKWCNPIFPLSERRKSFYLPLGAVPRQVFHLERRHFGFLTAVFHYLTIHIRLLFPSIWVKLGKAEI